MASLRHKARAVLRCSRCPPCPPLRSRLLPFVGGVGLGSSCRASASSHSICDPLPLATCSRTAYRHVLFQLVDRRIRGRARYACASQGHDVEGSHVSCAHVPLARTWSRGIPSSEGCWEMWQLENEGVATEDGRPTRSWRDTSSLCSQACVPWPLPPKPTHFHFPRLSYVSS